MVYLAEEGLRTEGRCFDHAWQVKPVHVKSYCYLKSYTSVTWRNISQEMLNHATSRVNESEHERALSEAEHRHTTALYHKAEHEVQRLQRELKRTIAKSRYVRGPRLLNGFRRYFYFLMISMILLMHEVIAF